MKQNHNFDIFEELDIKDVDLVTVRRINKLSELLYTMMKKRIDSKLSQRELERLTGIKQPMLARIEKMSSIPRLDTFISIIDALGLDIKLVNKNSSKLYDSKISKYIENKISVTEKQLQKLLSYVQMFNIFYNKNSLNYSEISSKEHGCYLIEEHEDDEDNINLDPKLKEVVDAVIKYFGIYSDSTLEYFIHQEEPLINAINSKDKIIDKSALKEYGEKIIKEYNIKSPKEIYKYSEAMFNKFADTLQKAQKKVDEASNELDTLVGTRTRMIQSKLKTIEYLDNEETKEILENN